MGSVFSEFKQIPFIKKKNHCSSEYPSVADGVQRILINDVLLFGFCFGEAMIENDVMPLLQYYNSFCIVFIENVSNC